MSKHVRLVVAAALLWCAAGTTVPVAAAGFTRCGPNGTVEEAGNGWLASHPTFADGRSDVTMIASPPYEPNLVYAGNGTLLLQSTDAACSWDEVYRAEPWIPGGVAEITSISVPSSANSSAYVYAGVTTTIGGVTRPGVAASEDRGRTWTLADADTGLPQVGRVIQVAASPQVPLVAFAVVDTAVPGVASRAELYSTSDAGRTWTARTTLPDSFGPRQLVVDPVRQSAVYGLQDAAPVRSLDNGATFGATDGSPGGPVGVLAAAPGAGGLRLAAGRTDANVVGRSANGGRTWTSLPSPVPPRHVALGPLQDLVAVSDGDELWLVTSGGAKPATPENGGAPVDLSITAPTVAGYSVTGIASGSVFRASYSFAGDPIPPVGGKPVLLLPVAPVTQFPSLLLPARLSVRLEAGQSMRVPYRLLVPRTPVAVDVMFVIDTTGSYQSFIDSLRQGLGRIVDALNAGGLDGRFGVAGFRDYPPPYGIAERADRPYLLRRRIGPSDDALGEALEGLKAGGGTTDGGQSSLTAIYQAVTGKGEVIKGKTIIAKGLDARFRPDALKLALVSTDTPPHYRGQKLSNGSEVVYQPGPSYGQTIDALRGHGVRAIGIPVASDEYGSSIPALKRLATASRALAPPGGVDCDGNGTVDLRTGQPLVCPIQFGTTVSTNAPLDPLVPRDPSSGLAAGIVGLVAGISDPQAVTLRVTRGADRARLVSAPTRVVDLHADNELDHTVLLTCPRGAARHYDVELAAATPIRSLAGGSIALACGGPRTGHRLRGVPQESFGEAPGVDPPRGAAAQGIAEPNVNPQLNTHPNPNPNPNPNINPAPHVNTGVAAEEQQQLQVALAVGDLGTAARGATELAMSDRRRAAEPGPAFGLAAAALVSAAGVTAFRTRHRAVLAAARAR